jgi:hypothetical protein
MKYSAGNTSVLHLEFMLIAIVIGLAMVHLSWPSKRSMVSGPYLFRYLESALHVFDVAFGTPDNPDGWRYVGP